MVKNMEGMGCTPNRRTPMGMGVLQLPAKKLGGMKRWEKRNNMESFIAKAIENKKEEENKFKI